MCLAFRSFKGWALTVLLPLDAVLSGSGHLSTVRSVEPVTVPVSEGLRPELPLLANQEGEDKSLPNHIKKKTYWVADKL